MMAQPTTWLGVPPAQMMPGWSSIATVTGPSTTEPSCSATLRRSLLLHLVNRRTGFLLSRNTISLGTVATAMAYSAPMMRFFHLCDSGKTQITVASQSHRSYSHFSLWAWRSLTWTTKSQDDETGTGIAFVIGQGSRTSVARKSDVGRGMCT